MHAFVQVPHVSVRVCVVCSYWPDHHFHTRDRMGCTCDECQRLRVHVREMGGSCSCSQCQALHTIDLLGSFEVKMIASHIPVSDELLMDEGIIEDTRRVPPYSVPTRMSRVRLYTSRFVVRFRRRLGSWIAGVDLYDEDRD